MGYPAAKPFITVEEYLEGEQLSDLRHEYFDGMVKAMAGASVRHNTAAGWDPGISVAGGILRLESVGVDLDLDELRRELEGV